MVLVRKFTELHDKGMAYVNDCFMNHTLFCNWSYTDVSFEQLINISLVNNIVAGNENLAATLLLFNRANRLTYSEITTQLNLIHEVSDRLLQSLSRAEDEILVKESNMKAISENDSFKFNSKFTDNRKNMKVLVQLLLG
ncbi:hypothetical protein K1719_037752 [Acacia pycnantha]|nr:hypothetical protein K1719_037752 [Acacia pycnantha]